MFSFSVNPGDEHPVPNPGGGAPSKPVEMKEVSGGKSSAAVTLLIDWDAIQNSAYVKNGHSALLYVDTLLKHATRMGLRRYVNGKADAARVAAVEQSKREYEKRLKEGK